ncbi:MAG: hypothetical protein ACXWDO_01580 [Bacteroidia bacterium]
MYQDFLFFDKQKLKEIYEQINIFLQKKHRDKAKKTLDEILKEYFGNELNFFEQNEYEFILQSIQNNAKAEHVIILPELLLLAAKMREQDENEVLSIHLYKIALSFFEYAKSIDKNYSLVRLNFIAEIKQKLNSI